MLYLLCDILNGLRSDDRHPSEFAQSQIGRAAAVEKIERVLGLACASLDRIRVQQVADIRFRGEPQQQPNVSSRDGIADGQVCEFIVNIAIKDHDVGIPFERFRYHPAERNGIDEIKAESQRRHVPGLDVFVLPVYGFVWSPNPFISLEQSVAAHFADAREPGNIIPKSDQQDAKASFLQARLKRFDLRTLAGPVDARETY